MEDSERWGDPAESGSGQDQCTRTKKKTSTAPDRLVGLVVKAYASRAEDPGYESRLRRDFFGVESYQ